MTRFDWGSRAHHVTLESLMAERFNDLVAEEAEIAIQDLVQALSLLSVWPWNPFGDEERYRFNTMSLLIRGFSPD